MLSRLLDFILPRRCPICSRLLSGEEACICAHCLMQLPFYDARCDDGTLDLCDNEMARLFWLRIRIERAFALLQYKPDDDSSLLVTSAKYARRQDVAWMVGRMLATRMVEHKFFDDIDITIAMPTTSKRERERGMNQVQVMAEGMTQVLRELGAHTPLLLTDVVRRTHFERSQTSRTMQERILSVDSSDFSVVHAEQLRGKHILLLDDVMTTGTSLIALAQALNEAAGEDLRFSILAVGRTTKG